jgi:hypothetical protein
MGSVTATDGNTAVGQLALYKTTGGDNTAVGASALIGNTTGELNVAIGVGSAQYNEDGRLNTAIGSRALRLNVSGDRNVALGYQAAESITGDDNIAIGTTSLTSLTTGSSNIAIGVSSGRNLVTGSDNIYIGSGGLANESGVIRIGVRETHQRFSVPAIFNYQPNQSGWDVRADSDGNFYVLASSRKYKENIQSVSDLERDAVMLLRAVSFNYRAQPSAPHMSKQYGLIAEEVFDVLPEIVIANSAGEIESVNYEALIPLLISKVQRQQEELDQLRARVKKIEKFIGQE